MLLRVPGEYVSSINTLFSGLPYHFRECERMIVIAYVEVR